MRWEGGPCNWEAKDCKVLAVATKLLRHQSRRRNPVQQIYLNKHMQRGSQILSGWVKQCSLCTFHWHSVLSRTLWPKKWISICEWSVTNKQIKICSNKQCFSSVAAGVKYIIGGAVCLFGGSGGQIPPSNFEFRRCDFLYSGAF